MKIKSRNKTEISSIGIGIFMFFFLASWKSYMRNLQEKWWRYAIFGIFREDVENFRYLVHVSIQNYSTTILQMSKAAMREQSLDINVQKLIYFQIRGRCDRHDLVSTFLTNSTFFYVNAFIIVWTRYSWNY